MQTLFLYFTFSLNVGIDWKSLILHFILHVWLLLTLTIGEQNLDEEIQYHGNNEQPGVITYNSKVRISR